MLAWADVDRGRKLFILGLGSFAVEEIYRDALLAHRSLMLRVARAAEAALDSYELTGPHQQWRETFRMDVARCAGVLRWGFQGWVLPPAVLQAWAYFPALREDPRQLHKVASILARPAASPSRMHLIRYHDYWNDAEHAAGLHEIEEWGELTAVPGVGEV